MADERDTTERTNADALRRALAAIRDLRTRLAQAEQALREPVAIVGIGCRFPGGASDPAQFWEMLRSGRDVVREVPSDRWDLAQYFDADPAVPGRMYSRHGGFLTESIYDFDARFFGISPREADSLDPQHRLLLETSWEALEHAGIAPSSLSGTDAGVFVGISTADYLQQMQTQSDPRQIDPYMGTGGGSCAASGRLSFFLGLHGPNIAVDAACASSLVSVLLAAQALRNRQCSVALAGGVNAILTPETTVYMSNLRALSTTGRCATFDSSADGYVRGEGAGMLVLKRLADAERDGDMVHAVIRGGAFNHDGKSAGLTVPNGTAQRNVIVAALRDAGVAPAEVQYVEAHGTATPLGDPIELRALAAAYGDARVAPLGVGSVKTNMGHLEAAAGVAGLIKCALALEHGVIPPHLHLQHPTPHVDWATLPIEVITEARAWRDDTGRVAGVSSFGISGTIAHLLLEAAPVTHDDRRADEMLPVQLLPLSALDATALAAQAARLATALTSGTLQLADVAATLATGRTHFRERAALVATDVADAIAQLERVATGALDTIAAAGRTGAEPPRIAFLFTGQGAQYAGMGRALDAHYPVFRGAIERCSAVLDGLLPVPLRTLLFDDASGALLNETHCTQPAIFALEFAMAELLGSWGVHPRAVIGHSIGEYVAAVVAGALPLEAALALVAERGRLMQSLPSGGAMGAVGWPEAQVSDVLKRYPALDLAAVNAPGSCVISGPEADVLAVISEVKASGGEAARLIVSHAFHSRLMEPILDAFAQSAAGLVATEPSMSVISNLTGNVIGARQLGDATYWRDHLRGTVRFADGVRTLGSLGVDLIIEVGPTPSLIGQARETLRESTRRWLPTLRRGCDELRSIAECAAGLYIAGVDLDWAALHSAQRTRRVSLPTYPWQREHFRKKLVPREQRAASGPTRWSHPLLHGRVAGPMPAFECELGVAAPTFLTDHRIFGLPLFPATGFVELALAAGRDVFGDTPIALEQLLLRAPLRLPDTGTVAVQVALTPGEDDQYTARIYSRGEPATENDPAPWRLHASAMVATRLLVALPPTSLDTIQARCRTPIDVSGFYDTMRTFHADYGPAFRGIESLWHAPHEALAMVRLPDDIRATAADYRVHPALLDACLQLAPAAIGFADTATAADDAYVPVAIGSVRIIASGASSVWCHFTVPPETVAGQLTVICTVQLLADDGTVVAIVDGLTLRRISKSALHAMLREVTRDDTLLQVGWRAVDAVADRATTPPGRWLLLADEPGTCAHLADALRAEGQAADLIHLGDSFGVTGDGYQIDPAAQAHATQLFEAASQGALPIRGVVILWPYATAGLDLSLETLETVQSVVVRTALGLAQAADIAGVPLWIVTRGSQAFAGAVPDVTQAPLWGLGGVIATENPALGGVRIDLDPSGDVGAVSSLTDALLRPDAEPVIAFREGRRWVPRLQPAVVDTHEAGTLLRLGIRERGQLENLTLSSVARTLPGPDEVEIEVRAAGLNFRDVLNALGAYPGDPGQLGNECAGIVTAVGSNVTRLRVGDAVISMPQGGIATHVLAPAALTVLKPESLTFAEAATIPVTFLTAHYALHHLGKMQRGDRVLIHAALGGVGMAAMQLARAAGARIIATAGSKAKREHATSLGADVVADSRSLQFENTVRRGVDGGGVDIVLNSLAGEFIPAGLRLLRPGGRFIEIGKTDVWDDARVSREFPDVSYHVFFLGALAAMDADLVRAMLEELLTGFASGALTPLPQHVFALEEAETAFRFMAQARHSGKIVLTPRANAAIRENASYVITGGHTGLGLEVARSLVAQGARHLLLIGRRAPNDAALAAIGDMEALGAQIISEQADVAEPSQVARVLRTVTEQMPELRGVIHAAGVLDDAVLADMDWPQFARVLSPKVAGAWNLHQLTRRYTLDFFVCFSSVASLLGSPGQGNYAAANQFLDTLAHARRSQGLPALSINWGSWSGVGMAAALGEQHQQRLATSGLRMIAPADGVRVLQQLMQHAASPQVAVLPLDYEALAGRIPRLLSELQTGEERAAPRETASIDILGRLHEAEGDARLTMLDAILGEQVMRVLSPGTNRQPDAERTLAELGMDSLMAIEVRNRIKTHLDVTVTIGELMAGPTIRQLAEALLVRVLMKNGRPSVNAASGTQVNTLTDDANWESGSL